MKNFSFTILNSYDKNPRFVKNKDKNIIVMTDVAIYHGANIKWHDKEMTLSFNDWKAQRLSALVQIGINPLVESFDESEYDFSKFKYINLLSCMRNPSSHVSWSVLDGDFIYVKSGNLFNKY